MSRSTWFVMVLLAVPKSAALGWGDVPRQSLTSPSEQAFLDALDRPIELHLRRMPLGGLVDLINSRYYPAMLDEHSIKDVGVQPDEPVSIDISGVSLRRALSIILRPLDLTWYSGDGMLCIGTPEEASNRLSLRTYDVRDLVPFSVVDDQREYDLDMIIELITSSVMPNSWDEVGGPGAIQDYQHGDVLVLVVDQSEDVHDGIDLLLWQLRQYHGKIWNPPAITRSSSISAPPPVSAPAARHGRRYIEAAAWAEKAARQHQPPHVAPTRSPDAAKGFF